MSREDYYHCTPLPDAEVSSDPPEVPPYAGDERGLVQHQQQPATDWMQNPTEGLTDSSFQFSPLLDTNWVVGTSASNFPTPAPSQVSFLHSDCNDHRVY